MNKNNIDRNKIIVKMTKLHSKIKVKTYIT